MLPLLQACQSSLNTAGLALIMQTVATGLLVTACIANEDYSGALGDGIQVCGVWGQRAVVSASMCASVAVLLGSGQDA